RPCRHCAATGSDSALQHEAAGEWLAVTPLEATDHELPDDPLVRRAVFQSPCATMVFDQALRLRGVNDAMARLLGLPADHLRGLRPTDIGGRPQHSELERQLRHVLRTGRPHDMQTHMKARAESHAHAWLARLAPLTDRSGRVRGVCVTAHDFTEQFRARERLQLVNEASSRIGTTLDVTRTAQELADVCVPALADFVSVELLEPEEGGGEASGRLSPPVSLRRVARQTLTRDAPKDLAAVGELIVYPENSPQADSLTAGHSIVASVPSGDLDSWLSEDETQARRIEKFGVHAILSVPLQARGTTLGVAAFARFSQPEAFTHDDVLLAEEVTARAAVCIDNARRYSRERETTLTLQRSLLPRSLPRTAALEAATRYLPAARSGVGGDWFDVIPLSGMRVAMVVGDVVGHGIQASATMGRLRTAVRTLADIDLAPDELLTHLDDLVLHLSEEAGGDSGPGEVGATCLYAVYDPVSRRCTVARAGHPPPVVIPPGGPAQHLELPSGPPLGLGGLPFESAELELPEGSRLVLYTDGLVEDREHDIDVGLERLREALAGAGESPEETCRAVLDSRRPGKAADDVALIVARTRALPAGRIAEWPVPSDPAAVGEVRAAVTRKLAEWGLDELTFGTELILSELVTNAMRHGGAPIQVRMLYERHLVCEVYDSS
ncbi:SpoIIE family protein phosphatase, partial [Streptomyces werraensis]|uniref:SpoIIE family protein phosphatase n=1 Tax=Streptomyces werraensis TaxID=68284 RepID=UPI003437E655